MYRGFLSSSRDVLSILATMRASKLLRQSVGDTCSDLAIPIRETVGIR